MITFFSLCIHTGSVIVGFLPVQDDKGWASLHRHHSEVGGWRLGWSSHIRLTGFIFREVVEGGGDGSRLVWFLARLVDDVRLFGRRRGLISQHFPRYGRQSKAPTLPGCGVHFSFLKVLVQFQVFRSILKLQPKHNVCVHLPT